MNVVLVSDGPLLDSSNARNIPFFFTTKLYRMKEIASRNLEGAHLLIIELENASGDALERLRSALSKFQDLPKLCIIDKANRREVVQAAAFGNVEFIERVADLTVLIQRVRELMKPSLALTFPEDVPVKTREAFTQAAACLDEIALAAVTSRPMPVRMLATTLHHIYAALASDGISEWLKTVRCHHSLTHRHSLMVAGLVGAFSQALNWSQKDQELVILGGLLHDIGKALIPLTILDKPGGLSEDELELIRQHPIFSREILKSRIEIPLEVKKMAIQHHEFLDGSGYPQGLTAERIDPMVRVMTICDIFIALTEARSYKDAMPARTAYAHLAAMGGKLDQDLVRAFQPVVLSVDLGALNRTVETLFDENPLAGIAR